jgi:hypothetical protein
MLLAKSHKLSTLSIHMIFLAIRAITRLSLTFLMLFRYKNDGF